MHEPSLRTSRLVIAGGAAAAIAMAAGGFLAGRATSPTPAQRNVAPQPVAVATTPAPQLPRVLGRADIIAAAQLAADARAAGRPVPDEVSELEGHRFELIMPFGCHGPAPGDSTAPLRWRYDEEQQALRIHVASTSWLAADWGIDHPDPATIRAEGFWIDRPWTSSETCPPRLATALPVAESPTNLPGPTLAIVQFVPDEGEHEKSASRSFDLVKRMAPDQFEAAKGFRMRLTGRVRTVSGSAPVFCIQPAGGDQRPICAVSVAFEELAVEAPGSEERLGTWSLGQPIHAGNS
jgi:hypothetical protein